MNTRLTFSLLSLLMVLWVPSTFADSNRENLRTRYTNASPEERAAMRDQINAERHAARLQRFDTDGTGVLDPEQRAEAARVLRQEWLKVQGARQAAVEARKQQVHEKRDAMLRQRFDTNRDGTLSNAERQAAMETIRREQAAHQAKR